MNVMFAQEKKEHVNIKPICTGFDKTLHLSDFIMHIISNIQWHLDIHITIETFYTMIKS